MSNPAILSIPTIILLSLTVVLYVYLKIVRNEIIIPSKKKKLTIYLSIGASVLLGSFYLMINRTLDDWISGISVILILLSFLYEKKGLAEDYFVIHPLSKSGISYELVDKIILQEIPGTKEVKLYFFYHGIKVPGLRFSNSIQELLEFFNEHLRQDTEVEVIMN